ncbi:MAG: T9SS type A sorting domain-containing protein [Chitinophagaceae bacterium]|nr:MAG: T9SS type A sorting domain-containing protein [Chitinophagaceae bacterium]
MIKTTHIRPLQRLLVITSFLFSSMVSHAQPANDACSAPQLLVSGLAPTPVLGNIKNASISLPIASCSGNTASADVWYTFVAKTAFPVIKLTGIGSNLDDAFVLQVFQVNPCIGTPSIGCLSTSGTTLNYPCAMINAGAGLTPGTTYYIRIAKGGNNATTSGTSTTWDFNIAVVDPPASDIQVSRSYINITKGTTGGTVDPGDILEMRATFVIKSNRADSLAFMDTLFRNRGLALVPGSIALRTNEGLIYRSDVATKTAFTDDSTDNDAGYFRRPNGQDTTITINFGRAATRYARSFLLNTSLPTVFGSTCIIIATYRVRVYAPYNTKIRYNTGGVTYRDNNTGIYTNNTFKSDTLIVYQSVGLCPNAVSASNSIGVEFNGTFGAPATGAPLARNRGTSSFVYGYGYKPFTRGTSQNGPDDYYYTIANNTFATTPTTTNTWAKPDVTPNHRLFSHWDISGDHTGASNPLLGNPPCDTTLPVSATNPCGYMLTINSAYRADTAFQYDVTGLCPNTYYEISAWFKNLCAKCGADSTQKAFNAVGYVPSAPNDSSGVRPNIAFDVNGVDYYTTGDIVYAGTAAGGRDANNQWNKRGFTYLTGAGQTSFRLTLRNNAPGGGGNDWALDDIAVSTCLPNMSYSPSLNPSVCTGNALTINDTIRSYFNNYTNNQWQRSEDNGVTWTNVGPLTNPTPTYNSTLNTWQYITSYTIPVLNTSVSDSGDRYRVIVATTASNVSSTSCQVTDGISIINLAVRNCAPILATDLLAFHGKLKENKGVLSWTSSKEDNKVTYTIQRSSDGISFNTSGVVNSVENTQHETNTYSFTDPVPVNGKTYYRLLLVDAEGKTKYSRIIQLDNQFNGALELANLVNPFGNSLDFEIRSPKDNQVQVLLTDMFGKTVRKSTRIIYHGVNPLSIDETSTLPAGTYVLTVKTSDSILTKKVIKKN